MKNNRAIILCLIIIFIASCSPTDFDINVNAPPPCAVISGEQISLSISSSSFPKNAVIEWGVSGGVINPDSSGFAAVYTAPSEAGIVTITATLISGNSRIIKSETCQVLPLPATESPEIPTPTSTSIEMPTLTPTIMATYPPLPPTPCDQLGIEDFKLTSPLGLHGDVVAPTPVPPLTFHAPIKWEPSHCRLTIQIYMGGVPMREYILLASGELDTVNLNKNPYYRGERFSDFKSGDWIEIKIWVERASSPSDNVHFLYP